MKDLTALYYSIDDFCKVFKKDRAKHLIESKQNRRGPAPLLSVPEMMTIIVMFQQYYYREFPKLISYSRFI